MKIEDHMILVTTLENKVLCFCFSWYSKNKRLLGMENVRGCQIKFKYTENPAKGGQYQIKCNSQKIMQVYIFNLLEQGCLLLPSSLAFYLL